VNTEQAPSRIPTLDGWRGIAILLVLFDHTMNVFRGYGASPWVQTGQHGVTLFFVLSGFLITSSLLNGPIDLRSFYIRRIFRLMPVAWAYLGLLLLLNLRVHVVSKSAVLASLFFYRNFEAATFGSATWHFWSLSLEEQFYLVWPIVLLLAGARRSRWIAVVAISACALYRFAFWSHYNQELFNCQTQVRADALLAGCLMALCLRDPRLRLHIERWSGMLALPALCVFLFCISRFTLLPPLAESVSIVLLLTASVLHPQSTFAKPLSWQWLSKLGVISYSIYVWQELFMLVARGEGNFGRVLLLGVVLPLLVGCSYFYLERPLTRLGHSLSKRINRRPVAPRPHPALENESTA
jgi:peptidoglycan/LPS O-acetylase OafA/YrhL